MAYSTIKIDNREIGSAEFFEMMWNSAKQPSIKDGNAKLEKTEDIIYIIWNLPVYITCPYATEKCKTACYAETPETDFRKNAVLASRYANLAACTGDNAETFVPRMIAMIEKQISKKAYKGKKIRVRIHESGDFFSKRYAMQWLEIAAHFAGNGNIVFMAYTKSFPFFDGVTLPENFVLRASIWDDTPDDMREIVKRNAWPVYTAIPDDTVGYAIEKKYIECTCENCSTCEKHCFTRDNKNIFVRLHGRAAKKLVNDTDTLKQTIDYFA